MADMGVAKAKSEVQRMLLPFQALSRLEEVLEVAVRVETEAATTTRDLAAAKSALSAIQADHKLSQTQFEAYTEQIKSKRAELQKSYDEQESAQREKMDALKTQVALIESARDAAREVANRQMRADQDATGKKMVELNDQYAAQILAYKLEEDAVRSRLESAKAELAALLKRVGG